MEMTKLYSILAGFILLFSFVFLSPIFYLKDINIVSKPLFINLSDCQDSLDSLIDSHLISLFLFDLIDNKLASYSELRSFKIKFSSLNTLTITLIEREPWIASIVNGKSVFIDREGYILTYHQTSSSHYNDIFIVKGLLDKNFSQNIINPKLLTTLQLYVDLFKTFLPNHNLLLERIHTHSWQLILDDHIVIFLGDLTDLANKFARINYFLNNLDSADYPNLDYIDSRIDNKLIVKYANK